MSVWLVIVACVIVFGLALLLEGAGKRRPTTLVTPPPEILTLVDQLLAQSKRGEAIRVYQLATGASPADARAIIMARQETHSSVSSDGRPLDPSQLDPQWRSRIDQALASGRSIEAIKLYRQATGANIAQARDVIMNQYRP